MEKVADALNLSIGEVFKLENSEIEAEYRITKNGLEKKLDNQNCWHVDSETLSDLLTGKAKVKQSTIYFEDDEIFGLEGENTLYRKEEFGYFEKWTGNSWVSCNEVVSKIYDKKIPVVKYPNWILNSEEKDFIIRNAKGDKVFAVTTYLDNVGNRYLDLDLLDSDDFLYNRTVFIGKNGMFKILECGVQYMLIVLGMETK